MSAESSNSSRGAKASLPPLFSEFASDVEMAELIDYFVSELQSGIDSLAKAWQDDDRSQLRKLAHQLKGAAGGYGFPSITQAASDLETTIDQALESADISNRLNDLLSLCKRAAVSGASGGDARIP